MDMCNYLRPIGNHCDGLDFDNQFLGDIDPLSKQAIEGYERSKHIAVGCKKFWETSQFRIDRMRVYIISADSRLVHSFNRTGTSQTEPQSEFSANSPQHYGFNQPTTLSSSVS